MYSNKAHISRQVATALLAGVSIFIIAILLPRFVISGTVPRLMTTHGLELILSVLAIAILGRGRFAEYGFCLPRGGHRWLLVAVWAPLLGIVATIGVLGLGGAGNPVAKSLSFPQIILFIWISSSIIEEVFTRGFLQGHLSGLSGKYVKLLFWRVEWPVLISAAFFGCMHLVLLVSGADAITTTVTVLFTFSLGLMAGYIRSLTGSLVPAIVVHFLANVGGLIGGIIYTIICILTGGSPPGM
ncbi:MAG: CPBP family intramembrane metalloprotease [Candidatus Zixiibacteriota bacterium]|nr:MAG: CPBP family intramembrane metalloprotease [candidate division Zixibacteria bacterium]